MSSQWIDITAQDGGQYGAYLALPPAGTGPGLVLFQEIFGVNEHIRAVADQYALDGFVVLAPDVFWRDAPRVELGYTGEDFDRAIALMKAAQPEQLAADIRTTVATLRARPEVDAAGGKVGAIGYCMGGRLAYIAAADPGVEAAVAYYGGGIHDQLQRSGSISCPMLFHYAEQDHAIPLDKVEEVRKAFAGKPAELHVYPSATHGFNCWMRGSYHPASAALAHGRSLQFLAQNLF